MMSGPGIVTIGNYFNDLAQGGGNSPLGLNVGQGIDGGPIAEFTTVDTTLNNNNGRGSAFARTGLAVQIGGAWVLVIGLLVVSYMMLRPRVV